MIDLVQEESVEVDHLFLGHLKHFSEAGGRYVYLMEKSFHSILWNTTNPHIQEPYDGIVDRLATRGLVAEINVKSGGEQRAYVALTKEGLGKLPTNNMAVGLGTIDRFFQ